VKHIVDIQEGRSWHTRESGAYSVLMERRWIPKPLIQKAVSKTGMLRAYHFAQRVAGGLRHFDPSDRIGVVCAPAP
jgi:hypothetical protein